MGYLRSHLGDTSPFRLSDLTDAIASIADTSLPNSLVASSLNEPIIPIQRVPQSRLLGGLRLCLMSDLARLIVTN